MVSATVVREESMKRSALTLLVYAIPLLFIGLGISLAQQNPPAIKENASYFPRRAFADLTYDSFVVGIFQNHLRSLDEPSLAQSSTNRFAIRCLLMSSYKGDEVIRIEAVDGQSTTAVYKRSAENPDISSKFSVRQRRPSRQKVEDLQTQVQQNGVLNLSNRQDAQSSDGPIWLLEINDHGVYHASYRVDPDPGAFTETCRQTARVADMPLEIE